MRSEDRVHPWQPIEDQAREAPKREASPVPDREAVDLLIVGGGINGAGIARDAAGRGPSVLLCEQNDLASGTSSASTKIVAPV